MQKSIQIPLFCLVLAIIGTTPTLGQYRSVKNTTGGEATSSSYKTRFTLGEPVRGGITSSSMFRATTGFFVGDLMVVNSNEDGSSIPDVFALEQNYPNPFTYTTSIRYGLASPATVSIVVFDVLGRVVADLVNSESQESGYHTATWNGRTASGLFAPSGLYVYQLRITTLPGGKSSQQVLTRKMMLLR